MNNPELEAIKRAVLRDSVTNIYEIEIALKFEGCLDRQVIVYRWKHKTVLCIKFTLGKVREEFNFTCNHDNKLRINNEELVEKLKEFIKQI